MTRNRLLVGGVLIVLVCLGGVVFGVHGGPSGVDQPVMDWFRGHQNGTATPFIAAASDLFGPAAVAAWAALAALLFAVRDRVIGRALAVLGAVAANGVAVEALKFAVGRPRPPAMYHTGIPETSYSYPSGHVSGTAALLLSVAAVVVIGNRRPNRVWPWLAACGLTVLVAATRTYLGVHWFSDVAAGFAMGAASAMLVPPLVGYVLATLRHHSGDRLPAWVSVSAQHQHS